MYSLEKTDIEKLRQGNKKEFEKIYIGFFDVLFSLCFQYTRKRDISEELVQDAFLKLWEAKENLQLNTNIKNFLYTITKNNCLNYLRNQQIVFKHLDLLKAMQYYYAAKTLQQMGDNIYEFDELKEKVNQAIEKLPDNLKQAFKMNRFDGMKYFEVAEYLKVSVKTVEIRISKALLILRKELKDYLPFFIIINFFAENLFFY